MEKIILKDGPVQLCVYPSCDISTNRRYDFRGVLYPVCREKHYSESVLTVMSDSLQRLKNLTEVKSLS